ncbi:MAG: tetratricopeptide repeat protein [Rhodospirillales bacterium]|nr:tetratricopeptide repeat protein [Rhodospirillales bacterium]
MSLILKALKKSEEDRDKAAKPPADTSPADETSPPEPSTIEPPQPEPAVIEQTAPISPASKSPRPMLIGAGAILVLGIAAWAIFQNPFETQPPSPTQPIAEAEANIKAATIAKAKAEAEAKAKAKAAAIAKAKAEAEAKAKAAAIAQAKAEAEAEANIKATAITKAEAEAKVEVVARKRPIANDAADFFQRGQAFEQEGLFERAIEEYTQAILARPNFAPAHFGRGWSHEGKGNHDAAIRNFTRAVELDPRFTDAFFARAWAYEQSGSSGRAIDDYSRVIDLAPNHPAALFSRGFLAFYQDRMDSAADDFATVYEVAQGGLRDYALIWRYLSEVRGGADMVKSMTAFEGKGDRETWPGILVSLFSGAVQPGDALVTARHDNPKTQRENECIAYFFIGQLHLIQGDQPGAIEFFRKTIATGASQLRQYAAAKIELKRLQH